LHLVLADVVLAVEEGFQILGEHLVVYSLVVGDQTFAQTALEQQYTVFDHERPCVLKGEHQVDQRVQNKVVRLDHVGRR